MRLSELGNFLPIISKKSVCKIYGTRLYNIHSEDTFFAKIGAYTINVTIYCNDKYVIDLSRTYQDIPRGVRESLSFEDYYTYSKNARRITESYSFSYNPITKFLPIMNGIVRMDIMVKMLHLINFCAIYKNKLYKRHIDYERVISNLLQKY